ncbi:VRR-NUC domain-containing protein [Pseudarthrobacter sp. HLT3-5]|uniref:VRR-NUC domain-containing protein n=1 Tax=Pseudarthrobacter cellobiosi TaxID=2953654 RepID=UPI00208F40CD|nr:VRR-NUC domain-containing protein [Pseudarthrobacter sp. HLT3-5]MCO4276116.1 VRR-NUC domain-containing protein [Pseudarthrobacter sp. HLT3-5]
MPSPNTAFIPKLSEAQFQRQVIDLAKLHGFHLIYHTHNSRRSATGFPDLVMVSGSRHRVLFRELKTDVGKVAPAQLEWLDALQLAGINAGVWRPVDLKSGHIIKDLRGDA